MTREHGGSVARRCDEHATAFDVEEDEDEELLDWAFRAGCKMVLLGLEAEEPAALTEMNKSRNHPR